MKKSTLLLALSLVLLSAACQKAPPATQLPDTWAVDAADVEPESDAENVDLVEMSPRAEASIQELMSAPLPALEQNDLTVAAARAAPAGDQVPWRMAAFMTDLAVSTSGWVGALISKGTPSVTLHWRKQNPRPTATTALVSESPVPDAESADLSLSSASTPEELRQQVEPLVAAAVAGGRVKNAEKLRENLFRAASEFREIGAALDQAPKGPWWVSRFRMDFQVDVTGKVTPAFEVGGDLRLRFDWFRLQRKAPALHASPVTPVASKLARQVLAFSNTVAEDLTVLAEDPGRLDQRGFQAYSYRVGLGLTHQADIGFATAKSSVIGHLFFSRDVKKPVVHPARFTEGTLAMVASDQTLPLNRRKFRKGLKKALRMGTFLSKIARKAEGKRWKVYEMKTGLDLTLGGKTGLAKVTGLATADITFYNQNF